MTGSRFGIVLAMGASAAGWAGPALAENPYASESASTSFLKMLTDRLEFTVNAIPSLLHFLRGLPGLLPGGTWLLLAGIVVAGLLAEYAGRAVLSRARSRGIDRLVGHSPMRAFALAFVLDTLAPPRRRPEVFALLRTANAAGVIFASAVLTMVSLSMALIVVTVLMIVAILAVGFASLRR